MDPDPMHLALSTDVVMDVVLSFLKAEDLLSCRLVSKFWNKAASSVLRKRSTMIKEILKEHYLMKLKECMDQSSDFPFAGLNIYEPSKLNSDRAMEFFQKYGEQFTRLQLETHWVMRFQDLAPFIGRLPRLSILDLYPPGSNRSRFVLQDSSAIPGDGKVLKLPSVRTVRFLRPSSRVVIEEMLREVLTAVSPSVQIECLDVKPGLVRALQSAGLLQAVSFMKFVTENDQNRKKFRTEMDQLLSNETLLLTKLDFHGSGCLSLDKLEKILLSSRHTMKELHLNLSWFNEYSWDNFPVLTNLTRLRLSTENDFFSGSLFRGRHGDKFPVLKEIHLCVKCAVKLERGSSYSSDLFVVPSVTRLNVEGYVEEDAMEQLALSFPNVKDMRVDYGFYNGDHATYCNGVNPFKIWSTGNFKCLETLRIWNFTVKQPSKYYINMDSFLTGIPVGICKNLRKRKPMNLVNSPYNEVLRDKPSILQLENLKELIVCVKLQDGLKELPADTSFISMVSVWYALEMMPDLQANFVYELDSKESSCKNQQDKTLLEAAFSHVQPSIKLERFH